MSDILRLSLPLTLWIASFSAVYGLQGLACSRLWPDRLAERPALLLAWLAAIAAQAVGLWLLRRAPDTSPFVQRTSLALGLVALGATIWTLAPVAVLPPCG